MALKRGRGGERGETICTYQRIIWMIYVFKDGRAIGMIQFWVLITDIKETTQRATNTKQVLGLEIKMRDIQIQLVKLGLFFQGLYWALMGQDVPCNESTKSTYTKVSQTIRT